MHTRAIRTFCLLSALALAAACGRNAAPPEAQTTTGVQPRNNATSVTGCLTQGAAGAFVLTSERDNETGGPATYHLNAPTTLNLADYVGQRVGVSGTIRAEQEVATTGAAVPQKPAKDAAGTPVVRTESQLDVKQLDVANVTPTGAKCAK